jgi:glycosyltransferase involved in cell wall biosynthesis
MRIAIFTETFVPAVNGVVTRLGHTISRLTGRGDQVLLVAPDGGVANFRGAHVVPVPNLPLPMYPEAVISVPNLDVWRRMDAFKPDVIHVVNPIVLGAAGVQIARSSNIPLVASFHTHIPRYLRHYALGLLEPVAWDLIRTLHNQAKLTLCTSRPTAEELVAHGFERVRVAWRGGVDVDLFHPSRATSEMRERLGGSDGQPLLLYVGRLSAEKALERLRAPLEAIPGARLALVGDGPHRQQLERHFEGGRVRFTGAMRGEELASAFASADVFVFPSETDTLGLALLEAMASGCPVVAARAGGITDVVREGKDGLLFQPGEDASLVGAVRQMIESPAMRELMRWSGRMHAESWSWGAAVDDLRQQYRAAIGTTRGERAA